MCDHNVVDQSIPTGSLLTGNSVFLFFNIGTFFKPYFVFLLHIFNQLYIKDRLSAYHGESVCEIAP